MFPGDEEAQDQPFEACDFTQQYVDMLNEHEPTKEGLDFHILGHMLFVALFNLRQFLTPIQMATYTTTLISQIEEGLQARRYHVEHPDEGQQVLDTPEWRAKVEAEIDDLVIPDDLSSLLGNTEEVEDVDSDEHGFTIEFTPDDEGTET